MALILLAVILARISNASNDEFNYFSNWRYIRSALKRAKAQAALAFGSRTSFDPSNQVGFAVGEKQ